MTEKVSEYARLIVGATCAGLGQALAQPAGTLLVEASACVGWEFIEAMNPGTEWEQSEGLCDLATDLRQELLRRNILHEGRVHLPALAPVLFQRLRDSGAAYLFLTDIIEVKPEGDGFAVTLFNQGGRREVTVKRLLDTTTHLATRPDETVALQSKHIHATLHYRGAAKTPETVPASTAEFTFIPGRFPREAFLSLALPLAADWPQARAALHRFWLERPTAFADWELASVATRLAEVPVKVESPADWSVLQSAGFVNPLRAFSAGVCCGTAAGVLS